MAGLLGEERRALLLAILHRDDVIRLESAADELGVSAMTVRRDLADLAAEGAVRRVRGGAVAAITPRPFEERRATRGAQKAVLARKAAELVPRSGAVAMDASSTTGVLLAHLAEVDDLLVVSNSVENAATARQIAGVRSILVGGEREDRTGSYVGPFATRAVAAATYARFFTSAAAIDLRGSSEVTAEEAAMKSAFAAAADETVLLIDSSKLGDRALASALDWSQIDLLVTDLAADDTRLDPYRPLVQIV